jgi:pyridoxamine 5'-phosphate oxidase family protein
MLRLEDPVMSLTEAEIDYLSSQRLGRIATVAADGTPQVRPTSFYYNAELGTIDVGGLRMADTQKYRNVQAGSRAALVVDDVASTDPWRVRGIEIRGEAEALTGQEPYMQGFTSDIVRIHPRRIISWGLESEGPFQQNARNVAARA